MEKSSSQGRFFILSEGPVASPGSCTICGYASRERRYLDPRLDFEFYGSVIFCELCIISMGQEFGLISPDKVAEIEARLENAQTELIKLGAVAAAMEDFRVAIGAVTGEGSVSDGDKLPDLSPDTDPSTDGGNPLAIISGESSGDEAFDVSSLSEGPDDISDSTDPFGFFNL